MWLMDWYTHLALWTDFWFKVSIYNFEFFFKSIDPYVVEKNFSDEHPD